MGESLTYDLAESAERIGGYPRSGWRRNCAPGKIPGRKIGVQMADDRERHRSCC